MDAGYMDKYIMPASIELSNYYFHQISARSNGIPQCNRSWMQYKLDRYSCVFFRIPPSIGLKNYI